MSSTAITADQLATWRHELLTDVRKEVEQAKKEIIETMRAEFWNDIAMNSVQLVMLCRVLQLLP